MSTKLRQFAFGLLATLLPVALAAVYGCGLIFLLILSFLRNQGSELPITIGVALATHAAGLALAWRYPRKPLVLACVMHVSAAAIFVVATGMPGIIGMLCFGCMAALVVGGSLATAKHLASLYPDSSVVTQGVAAGLQCCLWFAAMAYLYTH